MAWKTYFGYSDARYEPEADLVKNFYESRLVDLKLERKTQGACIVVAPKGAGKTELRRMTEHRARQSGDFVWTIDEDLTRTVEHPERGAAKIKRELTGLLLSGISAKVATESRLATKLAKSWRPKMEELLHRLGAVPKGVGAGPIQIDIDLTALFRNTQPKFDSVPMSEYREPLTALLGSHRAYILIDDVDEVFDGAYESPAIVEGLLRSVVDINHEFGERLHVIVFLKAGLYAAYYDQARAHNSIRDFVTFMQWSPSTLVDLLAHRIRVKHEASSSDPVTLWGLEFSGDKATVQEAQRFVVDRCNYGPRDVIMLSNQAKEFAESSKISMQHLLDAERAYCQDKMQLLVGDFGQVYPEIDSLIMKAFSRKQVEYGRSEFEAFLRTEIIQNKEFAGQAPFRSYIRFMPESRLIRLLFDLGLLGLRTSDHSVHLYATTGPPPGDLDQVASYRIHPAYHRCLQLK